MKYPLASCLSLILATSACVGADNLLQNGDFATESQGWTLQKGATIEQEGDNTFLHLVSDRVEYGQEAHQDIKAEPGRWLEFSGRMRVNNLTTGDEKWHNARVQLTWKDMAGLDVTPWPASPEHQVPTEGWVEFKKYMKVPATAETLRVAPALFRCLGDADYDDLVIKLVEESEVPPADVSKAEQR